MANTATQNRLRYFKDRTSRFVAFRHKPELADLAKTYQLQLCGCGPESLDTAAKYFGVDSANAQDRELLAYILAEVVFGQHRGRPKGSKTAWHKDRHLELWAAYKAVKRNEPNLSDAGIAKRLADDREGEFRNYGSEQIRQQIAALKRLKKSLDVVREHYDNPRKVAKLKLGPTELAIVKKGLRRWAAPFE